MRQILQSRTKLQIVMPQPTFFFKNQSDRGLHPSRSDFKAIRQVFGSNQKGVWTHEIYFN